MPAFPYIAVTDGPKALRFYGEAFGAEVFHRVDDPQSGALIHARMRIGDAVIMLHGHNPDVAGVAATGVAPPGLLGGTSVTVRLLVAERAIVDRFHDRSCKLGARSVADPGPVYWGEYFARIVDPFGHAWAFGSLLSGE